MIHSVPTRYGSAADLSNQAGGQGPMAQNHFRRRGTTARLVL